VLVERLSSSVPSGSGGQDINLDDRIPSRPMQFTSYQIMCRLGCARLVTGWSVGSTSVTMLIDANLRMSAEPCRLRTCSSNARAAHPSLRANWSLDRRPDAHGYNRATRGSMSRLSTLHMAKPCFREASIQRQTKKSIVIGDSALTFDSDLRRDPSKRGGRSVSPGLSFYPPRAYIK